MISIYEVCDNVDEIAKIHTEFVKKRIIEVIDFYLEIYKIRENRRSFSNENTIKNTLKKFGSLNGKTKTKLIKALFKKNKPKKIDEYHFILNTNSLLDKAKANRTVYKELNFVKENINKLVTLEFHKDYINTSLAYEEIENGVKNIDFIYKSIFDYDWFSKLGTDKEWSPYKFTQALNLKICVYCNINFTYTVFKEKSKGIRPDLDHFLPKDNNPLLALNFYNLIPSCTVCNSRLKGKKNFKYTTHLSPFEENPKHSHFKYDYIPLTVDGSLGKNEEIKISVKAKPNLSTPLLSKVNGNIKVFKLNEIATQHKDYVKDIIHKRVISNDKMIKIIQKNFKKAKLKKADAYRYIYGTYFKEKDFAKRPFSKMTKDIAYLLKDIKEY